MPKLKAITISLPTKIGEEIERIAKEECCSVSELLGETFRQYQSVRSLKKISRSGKKSARKRKLTPKAFGGPFEP